MVVHLDSQLAGRGQDQRPRPARRSAKQALESRQQEGHRLARAGWSAGNQVTAFKRRGDSLDLDGRWVIETLIAYASHEARMKLQLVKCHSN